MLQSLRQSATDIGRLLLPLLLLSWLSVFCGNCFALADVVAASHAMPADHGDTAHDCCDEPQAPCLGAGCDHDVDQAVMTGVATESDPAPFAWLALIPAEQLLRLQYPSDAALAPVPINAPGYISSALYLRHCTFLI